MTSWVKGRKRDNFWRCVRCVRLFAFSFAAIPVKKKPVMNDNTHDFSDLCLISPVVTPMEAEAARSGTFGVWNESVFRHARLTMCGTGKTQTCHPRPLPSFLPHSPPLLIICALRSVTLFGQMRLVIVCPICCVYDSFVYSLVHIRARRGQGDSFSAGLGPNSEVNLAQWFITFLAK